MKRFCGFWGLVFPKSRIAIRLPAILLFGASSLVSAQTAGDRSENPMVEEIVVTAQKREASIQDLSISMNAFSREDISEFGWDTVIEMGDQVPNVDMKFAFGNSMPVVTIRGVGMNDINANNKPTTSFYVDDVYLPSPAMMGVQNFDLERLEVLKGPQGALYGRNTNAGAVNVITRKPVDEVEGYVEAGYGRYERFDLEGAINWPISDTLAARVSAASTQQSSGPWDNQLTGERVGEMDTLMGRIQLRWTPRDNLEALLKLHGGRDESDPYLFQHVGFFEPGTFSFCDAFLQGRLDPNCVDFGQYSNPEGFDDPFSGEWNTNFITGTTAGNKVDTRDDEWYGASLTIDWQIAIATLTSITAYEEYKRFNPKESDGSPLLGVDNYWTTDITQFSQEFRLVSRETGDSSFSWIAGVYYARDTNVEPFGYQQFLDDWFLTRLRKRTDQESEHISAYVQTVWQLAPKWSLEVGGRLLWEETTFSGVSVDVNPYNTSLFSPGAIGPVGGSYQGGDDDVDFTGAATLNFEPNDVTLLYAKLARGYKSFSFIGGFQFDRENFDVTDPETLLTYEIGAKTSFFDGRLIANAAAFYNDYTDLQAFAVPPGRTVTTLTNLESAETKGIEIDLAATISANLEFSVGVGFLDTENKDARPQFQGGELPNAPELSVNSRIHYERAVGRDGLMLAASANWTYQSDHFKEAVNVDALEIGPQDKLGARISLANPDSGWRVSLWGKNLLDEKYVQDTLSVTGAGWAVLILEYPRTYGISAEYSF